MEEKLRLGKIIGITALQENLEYFKTKEAFLNLTHGAEKLESKISIEYSLLHKEWDDPGILMRYILMRLSDEARNNAELEKMVKGSILFSKKEIKQGAATPEEHDMPAEYELTLYPNDQMTRDKDGNTRIEIKFSAEQGSTIRQKIYPGKILFINSYEKKYGPVDPQTIVADNEKKYGLKAIVYRSGCHYISVVKDKNGNWYKMDWFGKKDHKPEKIAGPFEPETDTTQVHILCYDRSGTA